MRAMGDALAHYHATAPCLAVAGWGVVRGREAIAASGGGAPWGRPVPKIIQGWPKLWANFRALIGIFIQSVGPSLAT
jgi:hypothetical protein